jgi:hypothetical protein
MELLIGVMDEVNCETRHDDEIEWIERVQRRRLSSFHIGRTDVRFTPCVFEI